MIIIAFLPVILETRFRVEDTYTYTFKRYLPDIVLTLLCVQ